ncbi:hypothetical protein HGRIS_012365 [Hohenbuehelia grisea]|uniref:Uncharacterized protein n=1 Tax=Hohenbuehelia grisea TaxID=104357 RepID=A0ABR3IS17_9AGAR
MTNISKKFLSIFRVLSTNATAAAGWCRLTENGTSEPSSSDWRSVSPMTCTSCKDHLDEEDIATINSWRERVHKQDSYESNPEVDSGNHATEIVDWRDVLDFGPQADEPKLFLE